MHGCYGTITLQQLGAAAWNKLLVIEQHYNKATSLHETFLLFFVTTMSNLTVADETQDPQKLKGWFFTPQAPLFILHNITFRFSSFQFYFSIYSPRTSCFGNSRIPV